MIHVPAVDHSHIIPITINGVDAIAILDTGVMPNLILHTVASNVQYQAPGYDTQGNIPVKTQTEFCMDADSLLVTLANGQMVSLHEQSTLSMCA